MTLPPWFAIATITVLVAVVTNRSLKADDIRWFNRLQRPPWLTFERAIPLIWTIIFICGAWSAVFVWNADPGTLPTWVLMAYYLVLELVTLSYTPVMCRSRSLRVGTILGGTGAILSILLAIAVQPISTVAALLLLPYILWSPVGTYTTWAMIRYNPNDA
ncbi:TspO/MBR family protein [Baaleninema sp.]|uniref:TspO/MBR family protein n=1 Tax=Baaleninema sp. TaxID=3101197 RepID=UPI003D016B4B